MKRSIKLIIAFVLGGIFFLSTFSYAGTYNSEEISYDTSTSGAVQNNVKDALDFLYNKTKSGASVECPENMSCVLKPGVTLNVSGPGSVDKGTVYVGLNESNTFKVTPNDGYTLASISCTNGYTLGSFKVLSNEAMSAQTITITNPGTTTDAVCSIEFSTNEISVSSTNLFWTNADKCGSNGSGCICYQIKNNVTNFTYESHTGCNFKSTRCYFTYNKSDDFNCSDLEYCRTCWGASDSYWSGDIYLRNYGNGSAACSGVITCAT